MWESIMRYACSGSLGYQIDASMEGLVAGFTNEYPNAQTTSGTHSSP